MLDTSMQNCELYPKPNRLREHASVKRNTNVESRIVASTLTMFVAESTAKLDANAKPRYVARITKKKLIVICSLFG